ncbi:hypothetical protein Ddc_19609 [Ditylenchus destructor]|nr:hypothetical protein Ddc_19609 [Ditylenchus destructor]
MFGANLRPFVIVAPWIHSFDRSSMQPVRTSNTLFTQECSYFVYCLQFFRIHIAFQISAEFGSNLKPFVIVAPWIRFILAFWIPNDVDYMAWISANTAPDPEMIACQRRSRRNFYNLGNKNYK